MDDGDLPLPREEIAASIEAILRREDWETLSLNSALVMLQDDLLPSEPLGIFRGYQPAIKPMFEQIRTRIQHERAAAELEPPTQRQRVDETEATDFAVNDEACRIGSVLGGNFEVITIK